MGSFDEREDTFEKQFARDADLQFKAKARRNKLLGRWAADLLGKVGAEAEAYADAVVAVEYEEKGSDDVFRKIRRDFDEAGVDQSDHQIQRTMETLLQTAIEQVRNES